MFTFRKIRGVVVSGVAVVAALTSTAGQSAAESGCFKVSGGYTEHTVARPELPVAGAVVHRRDVPG
jgi:predicted sugar kinase